MNEAKDKAWFAVQLERAINRVEQAAERGNQPFALVERHHLDPEDVTTIRLRLTKALYCGIRIRRFDCRVRYRLAGK